MVEGIRAAEIAQLWPHLTPEERAEIMALVRKDDAIWRPQPGPQAEAYASEANIVGYGGAAGGGKTDLMLGRILTKQQTAIIFRREATQLQGIYDRLAALLGNRDGFNSQDKIWRPPSKPHLQIEFGSVPNADDVGKYQGRPHDFIGFDEATNFLESQVRFLLGWLRSADETVVKQALLTFNPPTTAEGRWVISFFGPWLDKQHPNPAKPGEIRWFGTVNGKDYEVEDGRKFVIIDDEPSYDFDPADYLGREELIVQPLSRTFIKAKVTDNPRLMATGYMATLQAMPEPLRSQMLNGDFEAGMEDDPYQVIPTAWVDAAMARWTDKVAKGPQDSIGLDVARGGKDATTIAKRYGTWFDRVAHYPGISTPDGPTVASLAMSHRRDNAPIHVDVIGWGASAFDFLVQNGIHAEAVNGSVKTAELSVDGNLRFTNYRAQIWWRMREALDPNNPEPIALPPDAGLRADLCAPRWELRTNGIKIEDKDEVRKRIGRSPDKADAVIMALIPTPKNIDRPADDRRVTQGAMGWMG
jgi:hypothetical protein